MKKVQILERIRGIYEYSWLWRIVRWYKNSIWHPILYRTTHRYHILDLRDGGNGYDIGWNDSDRQILQANFLILKNFVEKEKNFELIDWDSDERSASAAKEIEILYRWWTFDRIVEHKKLSDDWKNCKTSYRFANDGDVYKMIHTGDDTKKLYLREQELYEKDTEMLLRLIKIRQHLWT